MQKVSLTSLDFDQRFVSYSQFTNFDFVDSFLKDESGNFFFFYIYSFSKINTGAAMATLKVSFGTQVYGSPVSQHINWFVNDYTFSVYLPLNWASRYLFYCNDEDCCLEIQKKKMYKESSYSLWKKSMNSRARLDCFTSFLSLVTFMTLTSYLTALYLSRLLFKNENNNMTHLKVLWELKGVI